MKTDNKISCTILHDNVLGGLVKSAAHRHRTLCLLLLLLLLLVRDQLAAYAAGRVPAAGAITASRTT